MGETKLGDCFLRCGIARMSKPMVRKEERAIYTIVQNTCWYYGATTGTTGVLRSKRERAVQNVRKRLTGTIDLECNRTDQIIRD